LTNQRVQTQNALLQLHQCPNIASLHVHGWYC